MRQAYKDVLFLFFLHQQVNRKLISEERYFWTQGRFLIAELKSLLREQALGRRMRWNEIRVGIETPYPLDSETAAAVEAAKQHYVMTWELLEEGDDLGQWLLESFLAKGNTALPDGAYGMMSGAKHLYSKMPTEDEVRPLFEDGRTTPSTSSPSLASATGCQRVKLLARDAMTAPGVSRIGDAVTNSILFRGSQTL